MAEAPDPVLALAAPERETLYTIVAVKQIETVVTVLPRSFTPPPNPEAPEEAPKAAEHIRKKTKVFEDDQKLMNRFDKETYLEFHTRCMKSIRDGYDLHVFLGKPDFHSLVAIVTVSTEPYAGCGLFAGRKYKKDEMIVPYYGFETEDDQGSYIMKSGRTLIDGRGSLTCAWAVNTTRPFSLNANNNATIKQGTKKFFPKFTATQEIAIGTEIFVPYGIGYTLAKPEQYTIYNDYKLTIKPMFTESNDVNQSMHTKLCLEIQGAAPQASRRTPTPAEKYKIFSEKLECIAEDIDAYKTRNGDDSYLSIKGKYYKLLDRSTFGKTLLYCMNDAKNKRSYINKKEMIADGIEPVICYLAYEHKDGYEKVTVSLPRTFDFEVNRTVELRWTYNTMAAAFVDAFTDLAI